MLTVHLSGPTLDRLAALAEQYGTTPDVMLARLIDRDPHEHDHRCPTCARLMEHEQGRVAAVAAGQGVLVLDPV